MFAVFFCKIHVNKLHIVKHFLLASLACALAKTAIVDKHHIVIIAIKITGVFCPALYAPCITMKVKNKTKGLRPVKMKTIDPNTGFGIKKQLFKGDIIFELKILF